MMFGKQKKVKALQNEERPKKKRNPQDRSKLTRGSQVQIRLTAAEVMELKAAAKENDMSLADFVMSGVHQSRRIVVPGAGALRSEIVRLGNNLNQAVKLAHSLRKEGKLIDAVSIELSADRAEAALEELQNWLIKWNVDLSYQHTKGE